MQLRRLIELSSNGRSNGDRDPVPSSPIGCTELLSGSGRGADFPGQVVHVPEAGLPLPERVQIGSWLEPVQLHDLDGAGARGPAVSDRNYQFYPRCLETGAARLAYEGLDRPVRHRVFPKHPALVRALPVPVLVPKG